MGRYRDPFDELFGFSRSMDRMLSSIVLTEGVRRPSLWRPPTDVYETDDQVVIIVEVAGMDPEKISVEFSDHILRISGSRLDRQRQATCHCLEVQYGDFSSEVYLPGHYNLDAIEAEYKDGFLTIALPKQRSDSRASAHALEATTK